MKYKVGDKTLLGDIIEIDNQNKEFCYKIQMRGYVPWYTESDIDAIIIKPKRNIDKIAELWSDGKREDAKELYDHIQFIEGSYSGTMINGLLAPYSEPSRYPKLTPDELKAVKWLIDGGFTHLKRLNGIWEMAESKEAYLYLTSFMPTAKCLRDAKWFTAEPIQLAELLAAQEGL